MTEENKGSGSGSGAGDIKNKTAKMSMDQAFAMIDQLQKSNEEKDGLIGDLSHQLEEANKVLEGQEKAKMIGEILPRSSFKMDDLVNKSIEDLKNIRTTLEVAMPPKVNSVRFGVKGADLSDRQKGLTVGDLSFVTAQKHKAGVG